MVINDFCMGGTATMCISIGTMTDTVIVFPDSDYIEPVVKPKKKDPFWSKQGKNKKGGRGRYVNNSRVL